MQGYAVLRPFSFRQESGGKNVNSTGIFFLLQIFTKYGKHICKNIGIFLVFSLLAWYNGIKQKGEEKMKSVVIIQADEAQSAELAEHFIKSGAFRVVGEAHDGVDGLELIERTRPDAVVLDIVLPGMDGLSLMDEILAKGLHPKMLVVSAFSAERIIESAERHGAGYFLVKPIECAVVQERLLELCESKPLSSAGEPYPTSREVDERISNIFITVGIPPHIKGYNYLREGVKMTMRTPSIINNITKQLYPQIGKKYDTSASKVERAIRHAIEVAWNRGRIETINTLFGVRAYVGNEKPTNGEFIALVADKMMIEKH